MIRADIKIKAQGEILLHFCWPEDFKVLPRKRTDLRSCPSLSIELTQGCSSSALRTVSLGQNYQENQMRSLM